jgi:hypothetical protein
MFKPNLKVKRFLVVLLLIVGGSGTVRAGLLTELLTRRAEEKRLKERVHEDLGRNLPNGVQVGEFVRLDESMYAVTDPMQWLEFARAENLNDIAQLKSLIRTVPGIMLLDASMRLLVMDYSSTILPGLSERASKRTRSTGQGVAQIRIELDEMGLLPENLLLVQVRVMDGPLKGRTGWLQANLVKP